MRLIDADRLKRQVAGRSYRAKTKFIELIDNSPTVEPVKHGRWECEIRNTIDGLHTYQQFRCSVCGMTYITNTPYCPNCGAKMDAEEAEP